MCRCTETPGGAVHIPVLAEAVAQWLAPHPDSLVVDLTVGPGGHSLLLARYLGPSGTLVGIDLDEQAMAIAGKALGDLRCRVILLKGNYAQVGRLLAERGLGPADVMLADLGLSSVQLADPRRGFSFQVDAPLDMRFDASIRTTAADIVNNADQQTLADLIHSFGQDRFARRIARLIVEYRQVEPIVTTGQLAAVVQRAYAGRRRCRIHPATRTFQALRICVNNELENLRLLLDQAPEVLRPGGRFGVISFHSLEDRLVKRSFREGTMAGLYRPLTDRPIMADRGQIVSNRRARSARLRIVERL